MSDISVSKHKVINKAMLASFHVLRDMVARSQFGRVKLNNSTKTDKNTFCFDRYTCLIRAF